MSAGPSTPIATAAGPGTGPQRASGPGDACPLCGAPLQADQEWCLRCGAAARTRLAGAPGWKGPIAAIAAVVALSLGVLAASLVSLAGGPGTASTHTVTITAASTPASTSAGALTGTAATTAGATVPTSPAATAPTPTSTGPAGTTKAPFKPIPGTRIPGTVGTPPASATTGGRQARPPASATP